MFSKLKNSWPHIFTQFPIFKYVIAISMYASFIIWLWYIKSIILLTITHIYSPDIYSNKARRLSTCCVRWNSKIGWFVCFLKAQSQQKCFNSRGLKNSNDHCNCNLSLVFILESVE